MKMRILKYGGVVFVALMLHLYLYHFQIIQNLDYRLYDFLVEVNGKNSVSLFNKKKEEHVVIVDIDEDSLHRYGQWPWPRIINAKLINQIGLMKPKTIGLNLIFSEKDRMSPVNIQAFYKEVFNYDIEMPSLAKSLKDNDLLLINSLEKSNVTGSIFLLEKPSLVHKCSDFVYPKVIFPPNDTFIKRNYAFCNHPNIQKSIKNFGFLNVQVDSDGFLRRVPLFMNYKDRTIPSFALATLLTLDRLKESRYKDKFSLLEHSFIIDRDASVLLNFHNVLPKVISAIDILNGKISMESIKDKIVLIGSSAIEDRYFLPNRQKISNTMIHAMVIENILEDQLYSQPHIYKEINLILSILLSLLIIWFLFKRWYIALLILFITTMSLSIMVLIVSYLSHIYISIGYLWIPFLDFFFIMSLYFIFLHVKEQEKAQQALMESHSAMVDSISLIASMHDDETGAHILRTKNYVKLLADYFYKKKMYLDILTPEYIHAMHEAAPLHDIGKIGIPDAILKKPGKLTEEEYEIMKTHSTLGKNVIQNTINAYSKNNFLKVAYNIAYYHHERWDGKGYPMGLKEDEIPLEAQFMALADVYDALISKRRYKEAFSFEKAENIIIEARSTVYSPELIDAFLELKDEFKKIALRWQDDL